MVRRRLGAIADESEFGKTVIKEITAPLLWYVRQSLNAEEGMMGQSFTEFKAGRPRGGSG